MNPRSRPAAILNGFTTSHRGRWVITHGVVGFDRGAIEEKTGPASQVVCVRAAGGRNRWQTTKLRLSMAIHILDDIRDDLPPKSPLVVNRVRMAQVKSASQVDKSARKFKVFPQRYAYHTWAS